MAKPITIDSRHNGGEKSREKSIISMHRRIAPRDREDPTGGIDKMGKTPINTIGGGGCMRRCTANAADILDDIALAIWAEHKGELRKIGMRKPASSIAIDCLIYHAVKNGCIDVKGPLTPKNNLYLAIIV